jgi:predicted alpha/beta-fold hydrolase
MYTCMHKHTWPSVSHMHPAYTEDARLVSEYVRLQYPDAWLTAVGFSMGANVLVKVRKAYVCARGELYS